MIQKTFTIDALKYLIVNKGKFIKIDDTEALGWYRGKTETNDTLISVKEDGEESFYIISPEQEKYILTETENKEILLERVTNVS